MKVQAQRTHTGVDLGQSSTNLQSCTERGDIEALSRRQVLLGFLFVGARTDFMIISQR